MKCSKISVIFGMIVFASANWMGCENRTPIPEAKTQLPANEKVSMSAINIPSAADLTLRAKSALSQDIFSIQLSPVFPATWPPDSESASLEWFVYESHALATGVIAYEVNGPISKVTIQSDGRKPHVETIDSPTATGRFSPMGKDGRQDISSAEQVLVEVLFGKRPLESSRPQLTPYLKWAESTPVIGADLRQRNTAFFHWLESSEP